MIKLFWTRLSSLAGSLYTIFRQNQSLLIFKQPINMHINIYYQRSNELVEASTTKEVL
jgi:hypothetical protein